MPWVVVYCVIVISWSYSPYQPQGGTLIFSYIRRLGSFFGVQNFGFSEKIIFFLGYEDFVDISWGSSQNWTILRGQFYAF